MSDEEIITVLKFHKLELTLDEFIQIMPYIKVNGIKYEDNKIKFHIKSKIGHRIKCYVSIKGLVDNTEPDYDDYKEDEEDD